MAVTVHFPEMDGNGEEEGGSEGGVDLGVANGRRQRGKCRGWKWPGSIALCSFCGLFWLVFPKN